MSQTRAHIYTQALIDAWRRFSADAPLGTDPETDDYPGLVENLFVVGCSGRDQFTFRNVGAGVERLFGRELVEHDFISLWATGDRPLVLAAAQCAILENGPVVINARAARIGGGPVDVEFTLAPIRNAKGEFSRLLGLCQALSDEVGATPPPVGRMRLEAVFPPTSPPAPPPAKPSLRLVVCND